MAFAVQEVEREAVRIVDERRLGEGTVTIAGRVTRAIAA